MNTISSETDVHAPARVVYDILLEPDYIPRLYPDLLTIESDPPGRMTVGQKYHITGKAGRRRLEILAESAELVPDRKVVTRHTPGGLFKSFEETVLLEEKGEIHCLRCRLVYAIQDGIPVMLISEAQPWTPGT
jgi:uncharacterized protein YbaR (Trm112 family)